MSNYFDFLNTNRNKAGYRSLRTIIMILIIAWSLVGMSPISVLATGPTIYYVDNTSGAGACSDSNSGLTPASPFCTMGKGATAANPGDTVHVLAGTYAETVLPKTGSAGNLVTFSAEPGVTVTGTPGATSSGGAFRITSKSYVVIDGFTVTGTADYGIYVWGSNHITISNNHVSNSGSPEDTFTRAGIYVNGTTDSTISGNTVDHNTSHGILLTNGSNNNTVSNNIAFANAEQYQRNAEGIRLNASNNNTILHNITYANEDSGLCFYTGSSNNLVLGNVIYGNGDHGIDFNASPNNTIVGNTVQGNVTAGINFEGGSAPGSGGATVVNNIMVDNGLRLLVGGGTASGQESNLRFEASSLTGNILDYNIFHLNSGTVQISWGLIDYTSLAAFKASSDGAGQETHGLQADPLFTAPAPVAERNLVAPYWVAINVGDYHLLGGSPAIDSANSDAPSEPLTDIEGNARLDDPSTANSGAGTRTYDDRGAYEFQPVPTTTSVSCTSPVTYGASTSCTATVTRASGANTPSGNVAWTVTGPTNIGSFGTSTCTNPTAATLECTASYTPGNYGDGTHQINAAYAGDTNFNPSNGSGNLTVNKDASTITVTGTTSFTYTGSPQGPSTSTVTGSSGAVTYSYVGTGSTSYPASATKPTDAGTYDVTATVAADSNYNSASSSATAFTISKAAPTCTVVGYTGAYDGAAHGASGSCTGVGGTLDILSGLDLGLSFTNVPGGTANWSFSNSNYSDDSGTAAIVLSEAPLTVTANNQTIPANSADPAFTFVYSGFVNGENSSVVTTAPTCGVFGAHAVAGVYDILCSGGVASNYTFSYVKGILTVTAVNSVPIFADVPFTGFANSFIERLYNAGITGGCGTNPLIYCPNNTVTRAQMAVFLLKGIHFGTAYSPAPASGTVFGDVPTSAFAAAWIEQLFAEGVTSGCGGGNYCPNNEVTRAQMAVFLLRAKHGSAYTPPPASGIAFGDVPANGFAAAWIEQLVAEGITAGCGSGNYCPNNSVTRAQMAVFLVKTFNLP